MFFLQVGKANPSEESQRLKSSVQYKMYNVLRLMVDVELREQEVQHIDSMKARESLNDS